jgi:hypothetical protein
MIKKICYVLIMFTILSLVVTLIYENVMTNISFLGGFQEYDFTMWSVFLAFFITSLFAFSIHGYIHLFKEE